MDNILDFDTFVNESLNEAYIGRINKDVTYKPGKSLGTYNIYDQGKFVKTVKLGVLQKMKKAKSRFSKDATKKTK